MAMKLEHLPCEEWPKDPGNLPFQRQKNCLQVSEGCPGPQERMADVRMAFEGDGTLWSLDTLQQRLDGHLLGMLPWG